MALTTVPASLSATALTLTTAAQPNVTSVGTLTSLTVDDITINGSTISDAADFLLDVGGDISLDADGGDIRLLDGGTQFGKFTRDGGDFLISSSENDKDIKFAGADGGANITALTLDMSEGGNATFNSAVATGGNLTVNGNTNLTGNLTVDSTTLLVNSSSNTVGIAQTPSGNFPLEITKVGGDAININSAADFSGIRMTDNSHSFALRNASNKFFIYDVTNTTQRVTLDDSGNFGIGTGTSTLLGKLHIAETAGGAAGVDFPIVLSSDRYQADYGVGIVFRPENLSTNYAHKTAIMGSGGGYGYNFADILFCFNESTTVGDQVSLSDAKVTFKKNGNVGIGISPTKKLTVFGTGAGNATVQIEGEGGADPYINFLANNTQHWSVGIDDSDDDKFKISKHSALGTNDYFTINTAGATTLSSSGGSAGFLYLNYIRGINDGNTGVNIAGSDILELQTGGSARLKIYSDGKVDIKNGGTDKIVRFINTGSGTQGITIGTTTGNSAGVGLHVGHTGTKAFLHPYNYGGGAYQQMEIACSDFVLKVNGSASGMSMNSSAVATFYGDIKINDANDRLIMNGVAREAKGGYIQGNQTVSYTINHTSQSTFHVRCGFNHYGLLSYGCVLDQIFANGPGGITSATATISSTTGPGGGWSVARVDNNNVTVSKSAGNYAGGGYYYIIVEGANL